MWPSTMNVGVELTPRLDASLMLDSTNSRYLSPVSRQEVKSKFTFPMNISLMLSANDFSLMLS